VARSTGVPFIVSPRGMLTAWALRFRGIKKRLAWLLYQRRDLLSAQVLHATSRAEAEGLRTLGLTQPIAIIPNGVELPPTGESIPSCLSSPPSSTKTALFLSRIHPVKGLLGLVEAWQMAKPPGWRMVIAGGAENGHLAEVEAEIRKRSLDNEFMFLGEVPDEAKWGLYQSADLFVLPSKSENFGIAVAEALAAGLPVITTCGTPWEELVTHRCGWWVEAAAAPLAEALRQATALPAAQRCEMGQRGRKLVEANYTWPAAARKMLAVYRWMLGQGDRPEWVLA
jgi:glycosyltransferase involved in cell wall biosynthesis